MIVTDPPYNIKKDSWDNIKNYKEWMKKVILKLQRVLKDNGSFYMFHSEMEVVADFMNFLKNETNFIFRQFIVWNKRFDGSIRKGFLDGYVAVENLRNYQQMAEYILFYTFQDGTGMSKIIGKCVYSIRDYIRSEILRARGKINLKEINKVLGTATNGGGVASACLSLNKTCPTLITEEHYLKLRDWLNERKEYEYLRKEYEDLRKEYEDLRFTFNNQKTHHSIWNYDIADKIGHITSKPLDLIKNILLHSSKENQIVLDPFIGSGTTAVACKQLNRKFIGCDIKQKYVDIANKRLEQETLVNYQKKLKQEVNDGTNE